MSARVVINGLDELIQALTDAPKDIRDQGLEIIKEEAEGCANEIRAAYAQHSKTGTLEKRVTTEFPSTTILVGIVRSRAPHAHLFEFGTKQRRTSTGANRGTMPASTPAITVPIARRRRERIQRRMGDMLRGLGYEVSGV